MKTWKLTLVANSIWHADDYLNDRNTNPIDVQYYLLRDDSEEELKKVYDDIDADSDIYNDAVICRNVELTEEDILDNGFDSIEEFEEELELALDDDSKRSSLHELEQYILNYSDWINIDVPNYDFDKSIEGAIIVFWSWRTYVGYCRKFEGMRYANCDDTNRMLTNRDSTFVTQCSILMTAEEVAASEDLRADLEDALWNRGWKWNNTHAVYAAIDELAPKDDDDDDNDDE